MSANAGDLYTFETINTSQKEIEPYKSKQWVQPIYDTYNAQNGTQIKFQCDGFRSSTDGCNIGEGFVEIPLIMAMSATTAMVGGFTTGADFCMALKSGHYNLINSFTVDLDGKNVKTLVPNENLYVNFKTLTSWSADDLQNNGDILGVVKDSATSWNYVAVGSAGTQGEGIVNNAMQTVTTTARYAGGANYGELFNAGLWKRAMNTSVRVDLATSKWYNLKSVANFSNESKNYVVSSGTTANAGESRVFYSIATIRLRDLHDMFDKMPIVRGLNMTLTLNLNVGNVSVTKTGATVETLGASAGVIASKVSIANSGTLPFMISTLTNDWKNDGGAVDGTMAFGIHYASVRNTSVGNQATYGIPAHPVNTARLYAPMIELQPLPEIAERYFTENRVKSVCFTDIQAYSILATSAGSTVNTQIVQGIANAKGIVCIPYLASTVLGIPEFQSPWDSCPATTSPLSMTNFNVLLNQKPVLPQNLSYSYEHFMEHASEVNAINGGLSTGMNSGLISFQDWENIYKYYYVSLQRHLPSESTVSKSLSIQFTNNNLVAMDLYIFVEIEREFLIDVESGKVVQLVK